MSSSSTVVARSSTPTAIETLQLASAWSESSLSESPRSTTGTALRKTDTNTATDRSSLNRRQSLHYLDLPGVESSGDNISNGKATEIPVPWLPLTEPVEMSESHLKRKPSAADEIPDLFQEDPNSEPSAIDDDGYYLLASNDLFEGLYAAISAGGDVKKNAHDNKLLIPSPDGDRARSTRLDLKDEQEYFAKLIDSVNSLQARQQFASRRGPLWESAIVMLESRYVHPQHLTEAEFVQLVLSQGNDTSKWMAENMKQISHRAVERLNRGYQKLRTAGISPTEIPEHHMHLFEWMEDWEQEEFINVAKRLQIWVMLEQEGFKGIEKVENFLELADPRLNRSIKSSKEDLEAWAFDRICIEEPVESPVQDGSFNTENDNSPLHYSIENTLYYYDSRIQQIRHLIHQAEREREDIHKKILYLEGKFMQSPKGGSAESSLGRGARLNEVGFEEAKAPGKQSPGDKDFAMPSLTCRAKEIRSDDNLPEQPDSKGKQVVRSLPTVKDSGDDNDDDGQSESGPALGYYALRQFVDSCIPITSQESVEEPSRLLTATEHSYISKLERLSEVAVDPSTYSAECLSSKISFREGANSYRAASGLDDTTHEPRPYAPRQNQDSVIQQSAPTARQTRISIQEVSALSQEGSADSYVVEDDGCYQRMVEDDASNCALYNGRRAPIKKQLGELSDGINERTRTRIDENHHTGSLRVRIKKRMSQLWHGNRSPITYEKPAGHSIRAQSRNSHSIYATIRSLGSLGLRQKTSDDESFY